MKAINSYLWMRHRDYSQGAGTLSKGGARKALRIVDLLIKYGKIQSRTLNSVLAAILLKDLGLSDSLYKVLKHADRRRLQLDPQLVRDLIGSLMQQVCPSRFMHCMLSQHDSCECE